MDLEIKEFTENYEKKYKKNDFKISKASNPSEKSSIEMNLKKKNVDGSESLVESETKRNFLVFHERMKEEQDLQKLNELKEEENSKLHEKITYLENELLKCKNFTNSYYIESHLKYFTGKLEENMYEDANKNQESIIMPKKPDEDSDISLFSNEQNNFIIFWDFTCKNAQKKGKFTSISLLKSVEDKEKSNFVTIIDAEIINISEKKIHLAEIIIKCSESKKYFFKNKVFLDLVCVWDKNDKSKNNFEEDFHNMLFKIFLKQIKIDNNFRLSIILHIGIE